MRQLLVPLSLGISFAVISYSVIYTTISDPSATPIMSSIALALIAILVAFKRITADQGGKGLTATLLTLIPDLISWSRKSDLRSTVFSFCVLGASALIYWIGPNSIHTINILTGIAPYIEINENTTIPVRGNGFYSEKIWRPGQSYESVVSNVKCLTAELRGWTPTPIEGILECGEPLEPSLIVNGIDLSNVDINTTDGRRIISGVDLLQKHLDAELPERDVKDSLLIATWNIRAFGRGIISGGPRLYESYFYIAEIISHFDIVAVQEVGVSTEAIESLLELLGPNWDVVYSLVSPGPLGNRERMAFFYDKRKVRTGPLIASVVTTEEQLARIPYAATFDVLERRFTIVSVHILFADSSREGRQKRVDEIKRLVDYLVGTKKTEPEWGGPLVLLGDFNAPDPSGPEIMALKDSEFYLDPDLVSLSSHIQGYVYDQIALLDTADTVTVSRVGVFDFFSDVFTNEQELEYRAEMGEKYLYNSDGEVNNISIRQKYYIQWRTFQMSDHFPKWMELRLSSANLK